jgi:peptide/nickel transport system substrate-binding protein
MKRVVQLIALCGLVVLMVPYARAQSPSEEQQDDKVVFRIGTTNELDSLNPFKAVEAPSFEMFFLNYDLLVGFGQEDLAPVPDLADSWETSEDGLTWTYHLSPDATFHDGQPVTSEDVKYTFERILDEQQALFIDYLRQIETIETPDEHTVVITTKKPSVQMLSMWVPILPKHVWEKIPADETKSFPNDSSIGSGPFQAVEWRRGQFLRLEANSDYFRGAPQVDEVIFQFYDNPDTMVQALKQGEVDYITGIPSRLFETLSAEEGVETLSSASPGFTELGMNTYEPTPEAINDLGAPKTSTGNPALLDVTVRQAINWAIDEQALTDKVLLGEGQVGSTIVPPPLAKYHLELDESEIMGFDIDKAKELLAQAGYEDTDDNGIVDKGGKDLELRLLVRTESSDTVKAGQFITSWLEEAGIKVDTKAVSDNTLTDVIYDADFDMFIWGWGSDPDPDFILSVLTCDQIMGWSDSFWCNEDYSRMYQEQKTQLDIEERAATIQDMQRLAYEESPYVVFFYDNALEAYRTDRFTGWTRQPADTGSVLFSYGPYTYMNLRPVGAEGSSQGSSDGGSPAIWIIVAIAVAVVLAVAIALMRRGSQEERA